MMHLVDALNNKPEGRGLDSRLYHWNFSFTISFLSHVMTDVEAPGGESGNV